MSFEELLRAPNNVANKRVVLPERSWRQRLVSLRSSDLIPSNASVVAESSVKEAIEIVKPLRRPLSPQFIRGPKTTRDGGRGLSSALHFPWGSALGMPQRTG